MVPMTLSMRRLPRITIRPIRPINTCPIVWTCFFYVLVCNLLGAFPWLGSPTGDINVTGAWPAVTAVTVTFTAPTLGLCRFLAFVRAGHGLVPGNEDRARSRDLAHRVCGFIIKHGVLAIRLFANMMGGHTVLAVIMLFIATAANSSIWWLYPVVVPSSIFGQLFVGTLELLFAFVQAYIFAFLATLFIGFAVHPH